MESEVSSPAMFLHLKERINRDVGFTFYNIGIKFFHF